MLCNANYYSTFFQFEIFCTKSLGSLFCLDGILFRFALELLDFPKLRLQATSLHIWEICFGWDFLQVVRQNKLYIKQLYRYAHRDAHLSPTHPTLHNLPTELFLSLVRTCIGVTHPTPDTLPHTLTRTQLPTHSRAPNSPHTHSHPTPHTLPHTTPS